MRRIVLEEPLARSAAWSRSVAFFALAVAIIGIVMARLGLDPTAAVAVEGGAMAFAILAILFALVAMAVIWRTGYRGTGRLLAALVIAALVLAYPAYLVAEAHGMPALDDAATDLVDPPASRRPRRRWTRAGDASRVNLRATSRPCSDASIPTSSRSSSTWSRSRRIA